MANEAVILELNHYIPARRYTVHSTTAITKGQLLKLVDPNTASGANIGQGDAFAGIAAMDKSATDGTTEISCWTQGIFDLTAAAGDTVINAGDLVVMSGANLISHIFNLNNLSGGAIVGKALETGSASEVIRVAVGSVV